MLEITTEISPYGRKNIRRKIHDDTCVKNRQKYGVGKKTKTIEKQTRTTQKHKIQSRTQLQQKQNKKESKVGENRLHTFNQLLPRIEVIPKYAEVAAKRNEGNGHEINFT